MNTLLIIRILTVAWTLFFAACTTPEKILETSEKISTVPHLLTGPYTWKPLKIGGGGWVVGMYIHPSEANLKYIRTDVSGAYRWDNSTSTWIQLVSTSSMPAAFVAYAGYEGVHSLVGAPSDPNIAYMAFRGEIFKSSNRGNTWTATGFLAKNVQMPANGPGRQEGERLAVDPNNSNVIYYGSVGNDLWVSQNGGSSWDKVVGVPTGVAAHGVNTVIFDKDSGVSSSKTNIIYVTVDGAGVFKSNDGGGSWSNISIGGPGTARSPRDAQIGPDRNYYVVYSSSAGLPGAVWKCSPVGIWTDISPSGSQTYEDIAVDPTDSQKLVVMKNGGAAWTSTNQGTTWNSQGFHRVSTSVWWLGQQTDFWLSIGELEFDPFDSGRVWLAEGLGVWTSKDLYDTGITWTEQSKGIEETCGNAVICPPGGKAITAMWDVGAFYHQDPDLYNAKRAFSTFISCWGLDWCPADPNFIVGTFHDHTEAHTITKASGYSTDGGQTWTRFHAVINGTVPTDLTYGNIAVSADSKDKIVWLPSNDKLPYYTTDRGNTWQQASFVGLSASGVTQNTTARKPLCADRVNAATFYFYNHLNGIFRSVNGGANWSKVGNSPANNRWNAMLKAAPGQAQDLWFAEGKQATPVGGLWHSTDGGATWAAVPGIQEAFSFGFGKAASGATFPTIFVAGVAGGQHGIYRSVDQGATWESIGVFPLGIFDYVDDIDGDKDVFGKVYAAFTSTGFVYGEP